MGKGAKSRERGDTERRSGQTLHDEGDVAPPPHRLPPTACHIAPKRPQPGKIPRHGVIVEVAPHHGAQPFSGVLDRHRPVSCIVPWMCVKPRTLRVSGFPFPFRRRRSMANRSNWIRRVFSGCSSSPNLSRRTKQKHAPPRSCALCVGHAALSLRELRHSAWRTDYARKPAISRENERTLHCYVAHPGRFIGHRCGLRFIASVPSLCGTRASGSCSPPHYW
jgi:hypothetical protein